MAFTAHGMAAKLMRLGCAFVPAVVVRSLLFSFGITLHNAACGSPYAHLTLLSQRYRPARSKRTIPVPRLLVLWRVGDRNCVGHRFEECFCSVVLNSHGWAVSLL
ncbi:hypothetical protein FKP32DRAFT_106897 [Trametes sanguinea]|nr:hypothetical protein FKP32DRAFT_106897 [Trametes sanguinea]